MAKSYNCPECPEAFTTAKIKQNDRKCPNCSVPLKHTMHKPGGSMEHAWVVDDSRRVPIPNAEEKDGPRYKAISPDDDPEIFRLVGPNPGKEMDFHIVYRDKAAQTHLRCPACGTYLHTTSITVGWQEDFCRANVKNGDGQWKKCRTRTRFHFIRRGTALEITT